MNTVKIVSVIDEEIRRLMQVRALLIQSNEQGSKTDRGLTKTAGKRGPGRPKKSSMSAEGRARIAEAQKRRWALAKKSKS